MKNWVDRKFGKVISFNDFEWPAEVDQLLKNINFHKLLKDQLNQDFYNLILNTTIPIKGLLKDSWKK